MIPAIEFTLFGSILLGNILLIILLLILISSEKMKNGYIAFISLLIFMCIYHFWGQGETIVQYITWTTFAMYILIGFIYSLLRSFLYGVKNKSTPKEYAIYDLKENVFRWWFMWPISLGYWIFSDCIRDIYNWLYTKLNFIFESVYKLGSNE